MGKYKTLFKKEDPNFTKCALLEHIANELALANDLYKIDMKLKYSDGTLKDEIEKALEGLE